MPGPAAAARHLSIGYRRPLIKLTAFGAFPYNGFGSRSIMRGVGLAVGRQPSKLIYTGSIPVPRSTRGLTNDPAKCRYLRKYRRRAAPNAKSPAASVTKVEGSGTGLASTVVSGKLNPLKSTPPP